jgi:predicted unusual protein kinase regulating ubiquinone biosynthesis (AarF/ABC1/UbiB family)
MDWLEGLHEGVFGYKSFAKVESNWASVMGFFMIIKFIIYAKSTDPHPGNFLMRGDGTMGIIDFGCIKVIPDLFYDNYFA